VTPLRAALSLNSVSLVKKLVSVGYDIDEEHFTRSKTGGTVLHDFIDDMHWVDLFLELGADFNKSNQRMGKTPLHLVVERKLVPAFDRLINLDGIDVNIQDFNGRTPLHIAAACGNFLQTLLDDPRVRTDLKDTSGYTPLEYATLSASWGGQAQLEDLLRFSEPILDPGEGSLSPLICAAQYEAKDTVHNLIPKVLNINKHRGVDRKGILHWAAINNWDDVVDAAVGLGKAEVNQTDHSGKTALHYAAELGNLSAARRLLKHGATVHSKDCNGRTAPHAAAVAGFADILNLLLLDSDVDVNEEDNEKRTLLHWAATWDWRSIMSSMLDHPNLVVTKTDCYRRNALHVAALCGCPNIFQLLMEREELDINDMDAFGNTVLHLAARCGSLSVTEVVLKNITSFQAQQRNKWGQSALDVAIRYNSADVKERLQMAGVRSFVVEKPLREFYLKRVTEATKETTEENANTCRALISVYDLKRLEKEEGREGW
jgi:ankyrin repeat protein